MTPREWYDEARRLRALLARIEGEVGYNDSRRYELPIVESRPAGSDCSYQLGSAASHSRGMRP